jgi:hypothetical protein
MGINREKTSLPAALLLLALLPAFAGALVFESRQGAGERVVPGIEAFNINSMSLRINGKPAALKRYQSSEPVKKILESCLAKAEKEGGRPVNNQYIWLAANSIFRAAADCSGADRFGYIYIVDKSNSAEFVVAGSCGTGTEIIKAEISSCGSSPAKGFDDGLTHFSGAKRVLSIEFISGNMTLNFGNFYRILGAGLAEITKYYAGEFKKKGYKVLNEEHFERKDNFMMKSGDKDIFISVSRESGVEISVFVMGAA